MSVIAEEGKPGYLVVLTADLGGKQLNFQFNFAQGASAADWGAELDKLTAVVDRQIARSQLPRERNVLTVKQNVAMTIEKDIENLNRTIDLIENNRDPDRRNQAPVSQHVVNRDAQKQALEKIRREIDDQKKLIGELEKKAA